MEHVATSEIIGRIEQADNILKLMDNIQYGWVDKDGSKHERLDSSRYSDHRLQSPEETLKSGVGVCWDEVELERYYFEKLGVKCQTYFIAYYDGKNNPSHTFLTFEDNGKYCWFEHSSWRQKGIYWYESERELLQDFWNRYLIDHSDEIVDDQNLRMYQYEKPESGISYSDFFEHCEGGCSVQLRDIDK